MCFLDRIYILSVVPQWADRWRLGGLDQCGVDFCSFMNTNGERMSSLLGRKVWEGKDKTQALRSSGFTHFTWTNDRLLSCRI